MNASYSNVSIKVPEGHTVRELIDDMGLDIQDVEGVFINGKIHHIDSVLRDGDRVAIFPPGTPGPYRLLLGIVNKGESSN
jgi:molybdopterin converting factor small subunit